MKQALGMTRCAAIQVAATALLAATLAACGGGGGSGGAGFGTRAPLPELAEDVLPTGPRIDVSARDFFPMNQGDTVTYGSHDDFGRALQVQREVTAGPDAQGTYTVVESVPANPSIASVTTRWQRRPEGIVAIDYQSSGRLPAPTVPLGNFLLYPTPFYPMGAIRTAVRQGSVGQDIDGDGLPESFRFEFEQEFTGFVDAQRGGRLDKLAQFRQHTVITIHPSRNDLLPYRLSDLTEQVTFSAHTGMTQAYRQEVMGAAGGSDPYDSLEGARTGTVGGRSIETAWNAGTTRHIELRHNSLVFEPVNGFYYAGMNSRATAGADSVARIDPATGDRIFSVALGGSVGAIGVSSDGTTLYAGLVGRAEIVRLSLPDLLVQQRIALPAGTSVYALAVSPTAADTLAYYGEGTGDGPYLLRAGVQQPRSPRGSVVPGSPDGSMIFSADGTSLFMIGGDPAGRALLRMAVLPDGISATVGKVADLIYGNAMSLVGSDLLAGSSLFRTSDMARLAAGPTPSDAVACAALRGSTRWACAPGTAFGLAVTVIDTATFALIEDGNVPLVQPLPTGVSSRIRSVPGPVGQVAVSVSGESSSYGDWLALFDNPDFR